MIRGLAKWIEKNMTKQFSAGGLVRIGFSALTRMAQTNPALALQMALAKYPSLAPIVNTVKDAASFNAAWDALSGSVEENGCLTFSISEMLPYPHQQIFKIVKADLDQIRSEMESAYREELAAAKSVIDAANPAKE